jgi:hypothetical protein
MPLTVRAVHAEAGASAVTMLDALDDLEDSASL